ITSADSRQPTRAAVRHWRLRGGRRSHTARPPPPPPAPRCPHRSPRSCGTPPVSCQPPPTRPPDLSPPAMAPNLQPPTAIQPTRSAWVRTRNQCEIAEMTYPRFRQVAAESPGLVFELATQLATRLDRTNRKLGDLAFVDVTGRVAHAIMDLCGEPDAMTHPEGMQIKVSRQELSRLVGCSREMAGRVLKVLEEQGLLRATGKTIVVFNA